MVFKQPAVTERSPFELDLSPEQVIELSGPMQQLIQSPAWKTFEDLLVGYRIRARQQAFEGDESGFQFWKGFVAGLQKAQELPQEILQDVARTVRDEGARKPQPRMRLADVEDAAGADVTF